jgi:hypothetical protein
MLYHEMATHDMIGGGIVATMKNKPVTFNLDSDKEKQLFEYVMGRPNFSGYVKELIEKEINRKKTEVVRTASGGIQIRIES